MTDRTKKKPLFPFPYYGGKVRHLEHILPLLKHDGVACYVEPFFGAGSVFFNLFPRFPVETINDINGDVIHFFKTLRDHPAELITALELTPFSREELKTAQTLPPAAGIERARRTFLCFTLARNAAKKGTWKYTRQMSRRGLSSAVNNYLSRIEALPEIVKMLRSVQIESRSAIETIKIWDSPETLFYLDPPYVPATRQASARQPYENEMTPADHEALLDLILDCAGAFAISGYSSPLYEDKLAGWDRHAFTAPCYASPLKENRARREEVVWTNYELAIGGLFS